MDEIRWLDASYGWMNLCIYAVSHLTRNIRENIQPGRFTRMTNISTLSAPLSLSPPPPGQEGHFCLIHTDWQIFANCALWALCHSLRRSRLPWKEPDNMSNYQNNVMFPAYHHSCELFRHRFLVCKCFMRNGCN